MTSTVPIPFLEPLICQCMFSPEVLYGLTNRPIGLTSASFNLAHPATASLIFIALIPGRSRISSFFRSESPTLFPTVGKLTVIIPNGQIQFE